jgi:peptide/nickel transport system permease protein
VATFFARRLVQLIPVAFGITLIVFLLVRLIPGDPARVILGIHATPELVNQVRESLGLNRSLPEQYWIFLKHLVRGDLGYSYFYSSSVASLVIARIAPTVFLLGYAALLCMLIAVPTAIVAALKRNTIWDQLARFTFVFGVGLPSYWLGIVLVLLLSIKVRAFPVAGYGSGLVGHVQYLFLPALTISLSLVPLVLRALRASMTETLQADYVDTARSKGLPQSVVLVRHVVRTALMPAVTVLGLNIGYLVGGTVIVENVFAIPGLGQLMINSISTRDYPTVQGVTLVFAVLVVFVNLLTDTVYMLLDPRVKGQLR